MLAKIPGGPPGVKGISLFIVPKYRVNDDGSLGTKNNIALAGLNHKMGHRGTTNCLLNFGETGECHGYLVGEPHQGLRYMFHMMNEARVAVGHGAAMSGLAGYLYSLDYARQRPQGRRLSNKDPQSDPVMIIEHADVKRLLMAQKAAVEGAMGLLYHCNSLIERRKLSTDVSEKDQLGLLLEILTPIAKSWPSEFCLEANKHAIQVLGGYGYTRDYPVERYYRDNRLNPIHEGTHGIQGLDLLGRKVPMQDGAAFEALMAAIEETVEQANGAAFSNDDAYEFSRGLGLVRATVVAVNACHDRERALANATLFLDALGHIVIAWQWLRQAIAAQEALEVSSQADRAFLEGKLAACRYFHRYELPKALAWLELVVSLDETCLNMPAEAFVGA